MILNTEQKISLYFQEIEKIDKNHENLFKSLPILSSSWHKCLTDNLPEIQEFSVSISEGMRVSNWNLFKIMFFMLSFVVSI